MLYQQDLRTRLDSHDLGASSRLIVVSNRGGVEHYIDDFGRMRRRDAGGGVAVALNSVAQDEPITWIAAACGFADKTVAIAGGQVDLGNGSLMKLVNIPEEIYDAYYGVFCNPLLWFIQHGLVEYLEGRDVTSEASDAWRDGYVPANRVFADAVIEEIERAGSGRVMLHDYHLYLAPRLIRDARPNATLQQFVHIPWPGPQAWQVLPDGLVRDILDGLLANDSIAFQTDADVENFLATCRAYLGQRAQVWERRGEIDYLDHTSTAWANPISLDIADLQTAAAAPEVQDFKRHLARTPERLIVRVDRLDPSKNVLRGFQAYERLLERNHKLHGQVRFLAFLVPSRESINEYAHYTRETLALAERINARFGTEEWRPVSIFHQQNRAQALAGLSLYDVLMVNSAADGMNLVSKEGPVLNERDGVVVLSKMAGSYEQLRPGVIGIDPFDVEEQTAALEEALQLDEETRASMAQRLRLGVSSHQLQDWLRLQIKDLAIHEYMKSLTLAGTRG